MAVAAVSGGLGGPMRQLRSHGSASTDQPRLLLLPATTPFSMLHLSLLHLPRDQPIDPYQAHQLAWKAFSDRVEGDRPFLFSLEKRPTHHSLLVQSRTAPSWDFLGGRGEVQTKTFDPSLIEPGTRLQFFLRANPTVDRKGFKDEKKRRIAVGINPELAFQRMGRPEDAPTTPDAVAAWRRNELLGWLERKGGDGGFRVDEAEPGPIIERRLVRSLNQRTRPMTFHEVEFTGTLEVTDAKEFVRTLEQGVGRGKAFGYGLLMIRSAK